MSKIIDYLITLFITTFGLGIISYLASLFLERLPDARS